MNPSVIQKIIVDTLKTQQIKLGNETATIDKANKILFKILTYKDHKVHPDWIIFYTLKKYGKYGNLTISILLNELINYQGSGSGAEIQCPKSTFRISVLADPFWKFTNISCPFPVEYYINFPIHNLVQKYKSYVYQFINLYKNKNTVHPTYKLPFTFCERTIMNGECTPLDSEGAVLYYKTLNHYFYTFYAFLNTVSQYIPDFIIHVNEFYIICKNYSEQAYVYVASENNQKLERLYNSAADIEKEWVCNYAFVTKDIYIFSEISLTEQMMCVTPTVLWLTVK